MYSNKVIVTNLSCIFHNVYNAYKSGSLLPVTKYSTSSGFSIVVWFVTMVPPETNELTSKYHKIKLSLYFLLSAHAKQKPPYLLFEDEKWRLIMKRLDKTIMQFHENRVEEEIKGWRIYNTTSTQTLYKSQLPKDTFKRNFLKVIVQLKVTYLNYFHGVVI